MAGAGGRRQEQSAGQRREHTLPFPASCRLPSGLPRCQTIVSLALIGKGPAHFSVPASKQSSEPRADPALASSAVRISCSFGGGSRNVDAEQIGPESRRLGIL